MCPVSSRRRKAPSGSTPTATPSSRSFGRPGAVTRQAAGRAAWASKAAIATAGPCRSYSSSRGSRWFRKAASTAARSSGSPPAARRSDVARSAISGGKSMPLTFRPTPHDHVQRALARAGHLRQDPRHLAPASRGLVDELDVVGPLESRREPQPASALASAPPTSSVSGGISGGGRFGRSRIEKYRFAPGGECQVRPSRPRPAVCASAVMTSPARRAAARPLAGEIVGRRAAPATTVRAAQPARGQDGRQSLRRRRRRSRAGPATARACATAPDAPVRSPRPAGSRTSSRWPARNE